MADPLYIAQLVIYLILLQPAIYCLFKHGRHGILGWLYVQLFCTVRVVGAAIIIHQGSSTGIAAVIISSFGLSPLLLAAAGILHEARAYRNPATNRKLEWLAAMQYHTLVSVCLVMIIISVVKLENRKITHTTQDVLKIGVALLIIAWILLVLWTLLSWRSRSIDKLAPGYLDGTKLLNAVSLALPVICIRLIYAAISLTLDIDGSTSGFPSSRIAKIIMSVVPEMVLTAMLLAFGIRTHNIKRLYSRVENDEVKNTEQGIALG